MHTFIYPSQDNFINNAENYKNKNFGIDEILEIYASNDGNELVYTDPVWHPAPTTTSSFGNNGWLAYASSSYFVYSGSQWYISNFTSSIEGNKTAIANFTGRFSNVTGSVPSGPKIALYVSGSGGLALGSFSGSLCLNTNTVITGSTTSASFDGYVYPGSSFSFLSIGTREYTVSPLTESLYGQGNTYGFNGTMYATIKTCLSGSFSGSITSSMFRGEVSGSANYGVDGFLSATNFQGVFTGQRTGSISPPKTNYLLKNPELSRTLVQFDVTNISASIAKNEISSSNIKFTLNLTACGQRNLPLNYTIYGYPISQSWNNGNGRWGSDGTLMGSSWNFRDYSGSYPWYKPDSGSYKQVDYLTNSSYKTASFEHGGGTWYYDVPSTYNDKDFWFCSSSAFPALSGSSLICSQSYTLGQQGNIEMDVTSIVRSWICGCIPNNGIILATSLETTVPPIGKTNGLLQFFSKETNTIYSPYLDVAWDDSVFNTGSLAPITGSIENLITLRSVKQQYKAGSMPKVFVFARDEYPLKSFNKAYQQPSMITPKYLPTSSYFMIKDAESEEVLIDFDQYSKLSCDSTYGNYFKFDTTGLPQERYFKIFIKAEYSDGTIDIVETDKVFKITR